MRDWIIDSGKLNDDIGHNQPWRYHVNPNEFDQDNTGQSLPQGGHEYDRIRIGASYRDRHDRESPGFEEYFERSYPHGGPEHEAGYGDRHDRRLPSPTRYPEQDRAPRPRSRQPSRLSEHVQSARRDLEEPIGNAQTLLRTADRRHQHGDLEENHRSSQNLRPRSRRLDGNPKRLCNASSNSMLICRSAEDDAIDPFSNDENGYDHRTNRRHRDRPISRSSDDSTSEPSIDPRDPQDSAGASKFGEQHEHENPALTMPIFGVISPKIVHQGNSRTSRTPRQHPFHRGENEEEYPGYIDDVREQRRDRPNMMN